MGETKESAVNRLFTDYHDHYGRTTLYKADLTQTMMGHFDNENPNLFDGIAGLLIALNKLPVSKYFVHGARGLAAVLVHDDEGYEVKGLYGRHPQQYTTYNTVSHDEYNGITYKCAVIQEFRKSVMNDIVEYGKDHNWCFVDTSPKAKPLNSIFKSPFSFFQALTALISGNRDGNQALYQLSHIRQPDEIAFYKIVSTKYKPSLFELLFLAVGLILTSRKPKGNTSGKIMAWGKLRSMELVHFSHPITDYAKKIFFKNLTNMYGEEYLSELFKIYYKDQNHPFHVLVRGLR